MLGHEAPVVARVRTHASPELRPLCHALPCRLDGSGRSPQLGIRTPSGLPD